MRQNGHGVEFTGRYDQTRVDYDRLPTKPVLDGEPVYEDHPVSFDATTAGHSIASDVRRPLYWDLFRARSDTPTATTRSGRSWRPARAPVNNPLLPWTEAIDQPGAAADAAWPRAHRVAAVPDANSRHDIIIYRRPSRRACLAPDAIGSWRRATNGTYAMVYAPVGRPFTCACRDHRREGQGLVVQPRTGAATAIGSFANTGQREFTPPDRGETLDWILVLDDESKKYPPPGTRR